MIWMCKFCIVLWIGDPHVIDFAYSKSGEWKAIKGKTYYGKDATVSGDAFKQEAVSPMSYWRETGSNSLLIRTLRVVASLLQGYLGMIVVSPSMASRALVNLNGSLFIIRVSRDFLLR